MKQSLQLRLGQQITMTPQLQQAIRLLQLSTLELQLEIQQALDSNIMLEVAEDEFEQEEGLDTDSSEDTYNRENAKESTVQNAEKEEFDGVDSFDGVDTLENQEIPNELSVDSDWEDIYDNSYNQFELSNPEVNGKELALQQGTTEESLQDYLLWQLDLTPFSDTDRIIALAIIDSIDEDGYLRTSIEDITLSLNNPQQSGEQENPSEDISPPHEELEALEELIDEAEVEAVLHRIQRFDPVGIGARDLKECLLLQLSELSPQEHEYLAEAKLLVAEHLEEELAKHDYTELLKSTKLSREVLQQAINLIQSLNPRPGGQIQSHTPNYIIPDVFVKKVKNEWVVDLNPEIAPKLRINNYYANLINRNNNSSSGNNNNNNNNNAADMSNLKNHLQEARWFIKSLRSRHETLLKVAQCIVKRQSDFLDYGEEAMKPLVLHDIASELEMHESTISRVTTQKFIHTPRGIFELKYFFSSHVSTNNGGECSSTAIRALIKKLIAAENVAKPLSDSKIASLLSERGIKVARRTVAKYREAMVIPPSNERKRLA